MADDQKNEHEDDLTSGIANQITGESYTTDDSGKKGGRATTESASEQLTGQTYDDDSE